ncbi:vitamin B12 dependent-methionine synthase activation domain-containing protein [Phocaeicola sp.]
MLEKELSLADLHISLSEIYEAMGYGSSVPDQAVEEEVRMLLGQIENRIHPRFFFFIMEGILEVEKQMLCVGATSFRIGKIIAHQLRGSEKFAFFAATAGVEFEKYQHVLQQEGDMVKIYIADALGSIIAEKAADCMEMALDSCICTKGWKHTNRFSPGYCGWHVSEQQKLFSLFPVSDPCGIRLTDSSLMVPIKSVSGVIGVGANVHKMEYTCGLCTYDKCYRRKQRK